MGPLVTLLLEAMRVPLIPRLMRPEKTLNGCGIQQLGRKPVTRNNFVI
jgi:hypothetical protein